MDISLSIFFSQQEYNFPSQSVSNLILAWKSQWCRCYQHLYTSVIVYVLCYMLMFCGVVKLREPTANQTAPCWGSARCRRCSSALCLHSSAASRSGCPALWTDCWKANTQKQVSSLLCPQAVTVSLRQVPLQSNKTFSWVLLVLKLICRLRHI